MAAQERTEQATPKRRQEAREKGQVLKSTEVNTAAILIAGTWLLQWALPSIGETLVHFTTRAFESAALADLSAATFRFKAIGAVWLVVTVLAPILLGLVIVAVLSNMLQFGFLLSAYPLKPQLSRINPVDGAKRLFSSRAVVELVKTVVKVMVIGGFAWQALHDKGPMLAMLAEMPAGPAAAALSHALTGVIWRVAGAFVVLAVADYLYQRWWLEKNLRMSRQEIKEELKQTEGDPHLRARLRQRARALSRQRMMQQVPKADVVITNPTHFAVALKYEGGMEAPVVLAKGERLIAQQIKTVAREHGVPIVENPPLAQALFKACDIGQQIPAELFKAVAEVLAFVYRLHPHRAPAGYRVA